MSDQASSGQSYGGFGVMYLVFLASTFILDIDPATGGFMSFLMAMGLSLVMLIVFTLMFIGISYVLKKVFSVVFSGIDTIYEFIFESIIVIFKLINPFYVAKLIDYVNNKPGDVVFKTVSFSGESLDVRVIAFLLTGGKSARGRVKRKVI